MVTYFRAVLWGVHRAGHTHGEASLSYLESVLLYNFTRTNMIPNAFVSRSEPSKDIILNATGLHSVGSSLIQEKKFFFSTKGNVLKPSFQVCKMELMKLLHFGPSSHSSWSTGV